MELACRCRSIDPLTHRDERDTQYLEFVQHRDKVAEVATKAIQSAAHHHIELSTLRIRDHLIQRRPTILRAADTAVDKLDGGPSSRFNVAAEFLELILWFLIEGGNAGVDCSSHLPELITTRSAVQLPTLEAKD